jgi:hypothetical protein
LPATIDQPLRCHPAAPCLAHHTVSASARLTASGALALCYEVRGEVDGIRIPAPQPPAAVDGLWQHTCCEAFVAAVDGQEYREFNFSPSGQWAMYRFLAYRERDAGFVPPVAPQSEFHRLADGFRLTAQIAPELLPPARVFQIGLSAILETADGSKSYWALAHAAAQPDFHLRQSFTLTFIRP